MSSDPQHWKDRVQDAASDTTIVKELAEQLRVDKLAAERKEKPSALCHALTVSKFSTLSESIAQILFPNFPKSVAREAYRGLIQNLKLSLDGAPRTGSVTGVWGDTPSNGSPSASDFATALQVLQYLSMNERPPGPEADAIFAAARTIADKSPRRKPRGCYICRLPLYVTHPAYPTSLCMPCGLFSAQEREAHLPSLAGKTALVTGGRVNLGREVALRLLRAGCIVFVSTRFDFDAEKSFLDEKDSKEWSGRLKIIKADFTSSRDVVQLIATLVRECSRLDILINNAAQTVALSTDEMDKRNTWNQYFLEESAERSEGKQIVVAAAEPPVDQGELHGQFENITTLAIPAAKNSWLQTIEDIPYQELLDVLTINSLVPFVLVRELLPLMRQRKGSTSKWAYIINVSSREGIFETTSRKTGHHLHTNMSKAAFNMITETCSGKYHEAGILMNTVDPGFMSMDVEEMKQKKNWVDCPIGWEDGAARVLFPVREAEEGRPMWGKFFKHFREYQWET